MDDKVDSSASRFSGCVKRVRLSLRQRSFCSKDQRRAAQATRAGCWNVGKTMIDTQSLMRPRLVLSRNSVFALLCWHPAVSNSVQITCLTFRQQIACCTQHFACHNSHTAQAHLNLEPMFVHILTRFEGLFSCMYDCQCTGEARTTRTHLQRLTVEVALKSKAHGAMGRAAVLGACHISTLCSTRDSFTYRRQASLAISPPHARPTLTRHTRTTQCRSLTLRPRRHAKAS